MNTKTKIVNAAIELFNAKGLSDIAIRDIANEVGISPGNFAYHFKNKEALLEHFYNNMYNEVAIDIVFSGDDGFEKFDTLMNQVVDFMMKYSFFYTDIVEIFRLCPSIREDYTSKYEGRKDIYKGILTHFISIGLIGKQNTPFFMDNITHTIWFTMTFWQAQKKVLPKDCREVQPYFVVWQVWQIITPYMTRKGIHQLKNLQQRNEH